MRKFATLLIFAITSASGFAGACDLHNRDKFDLKWLGSYDIPTGTEYQGVEFGGISGIDYISGSEFVIISDDRGGDRGTPRFYKVTLDYDFDGFKHVSILNQRHMLQPGGIPFPSDRHTVDPEEIRVAPNGNYYWSSEGNWSTDPASRFQPFVREMRPDGSYVRSLKTPDDYEYVDNKTRGGRSNKLFEAMALSSNGKYLYVANEDALLQDGSIATINHGSVVRVTKINTRTNKLVAQYAYPLSPVPIPPVEGGVADNGLTGMVLVNSDDFITVERSYAAGKGTTVRLHLACIDSKTTNVKKIRSLVDAEYQPMGKEPLLDMPPMYEGVKTDNVEGIAWGKRLRNGNRSLVLVTDNNFNTAQTTRFTVLEVIPR